MVRTKKFLSVLLAIVMLLQTLVIPNFAADVSGFVDFPTNSWSTAAMTAAVDNGLLKGTSDTTIEPSKNLTRAEFAAIITRAFGATKVADISHFADVDASDWYYNSVAMAVQMGVMNGTSDTTFSPAAYMKREDVILSLARVLFVDGDDTTVLDQFSDKGDIDYWAYKAVAGMVAEGYVNGYNDGTIKPLNYITREELAQLFHNIFKTYVSVKGTYDYIPGNGSVVIRTPDVTLRNMTINGDLVMADGIGEGNLTLVNVTVLGKIIARGGEDTVYFKNVEAEGNVIINDPNGVVNFHNYRDEKPFVDNLVENTPATFLERGGAVVGGGGGGGIGGGGGGGGGSPTYSLYFYESLEDLNEGNEPIKKVTGKKGTYVVVDSNVPDDEDMEKDGFEFMGWSKKNSVEGKKKNYFVRKEIGKVSGKWYAVYDPIATPTVTFKWTINGGDSEEIVFEDVMPDYVITEEDLDAFPNDDEMDKFGYEFKGWQNEHSNDIYKKDDFIDKTIYEIAGDNEEVTFEPVYDSLEFYFDFKDENGADLDLVGIEAGNALKENDIPTPELDESKELIGWTTVEGGTVVEYTNEVLTGKNVEEFEDELFFGDSTSEERTVKLYAVLADKEAINVVFVGKGTVTKYDPDAMLEDSEVPEDPEMANHNFKGWSQDPNAEDGEDRDYFLDKPVSELEGTWYPIFEKVYTITFVTSDGDVVVTKIEGESLEASEIPEIETEESEEFKGWTLTAGSTNVNFKNDALTANVVENVFDELEVKLYPVVVEKDAYTVIFDGEGEVTKYDPDAMLEDSEVPEDPEKENHNFKGWSQDPNAEDGEDRDYFLDKPVSELEGTWYPIFEKVYTITFVTSDGDVVVTKIEGESLEASEIPEIETEESEEFKGWTLTAGSTNVNFKNDALTANVVENVFDELEVKLYPVVVEKDAYTVVFDGEGEVTKYDPDAMLEDSEVPEDPEKANHTFKGWAKDPEATEGEDRDYFLNNPVSALVGTWYPIFEAIEEPDVYTIIFAITGADAVVTKTEGETLEDSEIPEIETDESEEFKGWTLTEGSTNVNFTNDALTADVVENVFNALKITLYPVVVKKDAYTVVFDGEGEVTKYDPNAMLEDSEVPEDPEKANHTFKGWAKDPEATEGEDRDYFLNNPVSALVGTWYPIFEAIEEPDVYTIIFAITGADAVVTKTEGETLEDSEIPEIETDESEEFKGWTITEGSTNVDFTDDDLTADVVENVFDALKITLYPVVVEKDAYTVVFDGEGEITKYDPNAMLEDSEVPEDPEKANHTFKGWSQDPNAEDGEDRDYFLDKPVSELEGTWYPIFEAHEYTVIFDGEGEVTKNDPNAMLEESEVPEDPKKENYTFKGWSQDSEATEGEDRDYFLNNPVSALVGTWYPIFEAVEGVDEYTIVFVTLGRDKTVKKLENEKIAANEIPEIPVDESQEFLGWTLTEGSTDVDFTNDDLTEDVVENLFSSTEVVLYYVIVDKECYNVKFVLPDEDLEDIFVSSYDPDYMLDESEVPEDLSKYDHTFMGWSQDSDAEDGEDRDYFLNNPISVIKGTWYPIFKENLDEYTITFVTSDGITDVTKTEREAIAEDEIPEVTAPGGYTFEGWSTTDGADEPEYTNDELTADVVKNVFSDFEVTLYPVFKLILVTYKVEFYVEGTVISTVEETLSDFADYVLDESDVYDVEHPEKPEDYKFVGWTTDEEGNGHVYTSEDLRISIKNLEKAYYAKFEKVTDNYFVFFKYTTGDKALETVEKTLSASEDYVLTSTDVHDVEYFEKPYEKYIFLGWTTTVDGTDYIASEELAGKSIKEIEGTYYAQFETLLELNFYDLGVSKYPVNDEPIYVHFGDSAVYPDYELYNELGYEKSYDKDYIADENYHEDTMHIDRDDVPYKHGHKLNYEWYYKNENGEFVRYDDSTVIEKDLDVYSKIKKIDILIEIPKSIVDIDEILTFNVPYEDDSRFLDLVRDALFFNKDQVVTKVDETGIEDKLYGKLQGIGESFFQDGGILNEENEINKTDVMIYFYQMMGGKENYKTWLWEEVEEALRDALGRNSEDDKKYLDLRNGRNQEQALKAFFEDNVYGLDFTRVDYADAMSQYVDSKDFIEMSTEEDVFYATTNNEFIMVKVEEKIASLSSIDAVIDEYIGDRIPEGLLNKLPMKMVEDIYNPRVQKFIDQLNEAREAAANGEDKEDYPIDSGIIFDIELVKEIMVPLMDYIKNSHEIALNKVIASENRVAELAEAYYVNNPYASGSEAGYRGFVNGYIIPELYVEDLDSDGLYTIRSFVDIYEDVLMPLSVETTDALLWYTDNISFSKIEKVLMDEENKEIALHFVNHTNALMADYAKNGLPENISEYYYDLLSDEVIADAVEKLDNKVSFDMMYFVETKLHSQLAEMLYMQFLNRLGVPAEMLLSKYVGSPAHKDYTEAEYDNYVEQLSEIWADTYTADDGLDNLFKIAGDDDEAEIAIKGFSATVIRSFANAMFD